MSFAEVNNGGFEQWSGSQPGAWTTIDSGIQLTPSNTIISEGNTSAAVTVTTGTQASTDLRQSISVVSGQTYTFSVDLYHTEGNIKARLYIDGYLGYSEPTQTNQWQTITETFTASSSQSIEVGLRFYDVAGFDGNETVYIDNFQPNSESTNPDPDTGSGSCSGELVTLALTTDNYGSETSWTITEAIAGIISSGSGYASNSDVTETFCLNTGQYTFTINDSYGDGICCSYGQGSYSLTSQTTTFASGGSFNSQASHSFNISSDDNSGGGNTDLPTYYEDATNKTGYALKTALYQIINGHNSRGYSAIWTFYANTERDLYYENDGTLLDIYSENPTTSDAYVYQNTNDQCGSYNSEADCYNREHSFPKSWFGGTNEPMNSDIHHIFASDGYVNSKRGNYPYGDVGSATYTSSNGSKLGQAATSLGYSGIVFEPIDEFKGDVARAHFYMATRYENVIATWEGNSTSSDAALVGNTTTVFEPWYLTMLKSWHQQDPVSQKEIDRNEAAYVYQGNRNPFVDYPDFVEMIWGQ